MADNTTIIFNQVAKTGTFGSVIDAVNSNFDLAKIAILNMKGKSAYEVWLEQDGNAGKSVQEFLASLKESGFTTQAVTTRPTVANADANTIYAVPDKSDEELEEPDIWREWICVDGVWKLLATHDGSGLSSALSDIDDLKSRNEPIVFTNSKTCNSFIKTLYVDTSAYNGEYDISGGLYIEYVPASNYIAMYDALSEGHQVVYRGLNQNESVYCGRRSNGIYYYIELNNSMLPSVKPARTKLNDWAYKIDPRPSFGGTTESPLLNKYVKKIWFEFDDESQRESWVGKLHLYSVSNTLSDDVYTQTLMIRYDYAPSSNLIWYQQTSGNQLVTRKVSGMTVNLLVDWEAMKGKTVNGEYSLITNECFMKELNTVKITDAVGDSSSIAFSQKGAQTLSGEIESNKAEINKINYHPNYLVNSTVGNKFIKKLYIDVSNYNGDDITYDETSGLPTNLKVFINPNSFRLYTNNYANYFVKIDFKDGVTEYSKVGTDTNGVLTGIFAYIEIDANNLPTTNYTYISIESIAYNKDNDPRIKKLNYIDNLEIDGAFRTLYINTDSYNGTSDGDWYISHIWNSGQGFYGIGLNSTGSLEEIYLRSTRKDKPIAVSYRGIYAYIDADWDLLSPITLDSTRRTILPKAFIRPDFLNEDATLKTFESSPVAMIKSSSSNGVSFANRTLSNVVYEGVWSKAFSELATRTNGDECKGYELTSDDIAVPTAIDGESVYNFTVTNQEDFNTLNSKINNALSSTTSAYTDVNIYINSGVYYAKGVGSWISGSSYVEIVNQKTVIPHIRIMEKDFSNKNLRIIGNGDVKIVVGNKQYGSVSEDKIDCGEYWKVPHADNSGNTIPFNYRYTYFDENLNHVDIVNVNKFNVCLSQVKKDNDLSTQLSKEIYYMTIPKGSCPIIPQDNTNDIWIIVTSGWRANKGNVIKTEEDQDGNIIVWFVVGISDGINMDNGYGGGRARFKFMNEKPHHNSILVRDGYIYVPKCLGYVTECRYDHFIQIASCKFNHVLIKGLHIIGGAANTSEQGYQSGLIHFSNATFYNNARIEDCKFTDIGTKALRTWSETSTSFTKNVDFINNVVDGCNGTALLFAKHTDGIRVVGNTFKNIGRVIDNTSVCGMEGKNAYIGYNTFIDFNYTAFRPGSWNTSSSSYDDTYCTTAIFEYNELYYTNEYMHNRMETSLMDGAPIYCSNRNKGVIIRYNFVHDIKGWRDRYAGIYLDGGCYNVSVYGNLVTNVGTNGIYINFWPDVYSKVSTCNLNNACVGNITDKSIWFKGNPHTDVLTDYWKQAICGANILLQSHYKPNIEMSDTENQITVDSVVCQLPNLYTKMEDLIDGEPYVNEELFSAMRALPIPEFIKQRFHKAISTKATDEGGK